MIKVEVLEAQSSGLCQDCEDCKKEFAPELSMTEFNEQIQNGQLVDEGRFSSWHCSECHETLGGQRFVAHAIGEESKELYHFSVCEGCTMKMAGYSWNEELDCWE